MLHECSDPALAYLLMYVKKFLGFIQLVGPIVALIGLTIHFISIMSSPENKKNKGKIKNWAIALAMLFFIPFIINLVMNLLDGTFDLPTCWANAENVVAYNN